MKCHHILLLFFCCVNVMVAFGQVDSVKADNTTSGCTHRDSLNLAKLNTVSNFMIAGGVGLCGAGSYLIYAGVQTYKTPAAPGSNDPTGDVHRNHSQGAGYIAGGVIGISAGIIVEALGIKKKLAFKKRVKQMQLQSGLLDNGHLGAMLNF